MARKARESKERETAPECQLLEPGKSSRQGSSVVLPDSANWLHIPGRLCRREGAFTQFTFQNGHKCSSQIFCNCKRWQANHVKPPIYAELTKMYGNLRHFSRNLQNLRNLQRKLLRALSSPPICFRLAVSAPSAACGLCKHSSLNTHLSSFEWDAMIGDAIGVCIMCIMWKTSTTRCDTFCDFWKVGLQQQVIQSIGAHEGPNHAFCLQATDHLAGLNLQVADVEAPLPNGDGDRFLNGKQR